MTNIKHDGKVEFRFFRPDVTSVAITGDFNGWSHGAMEMENAGGGWWTANAALPAGEYRFRYFADGRWFTDFAAHGVEFVKEVWNSVLVVPRLEKLNNNPRFAAA